MPAVSVILPTYNRADTILRAVHSVIRQGFQDWELLIIDDGSTDNTLVLVRDLDPRIRVLAQSNAGVYVARNTGLTASRGDYIAFLDSDDEWMPHFLEITTAFLRSSPDEHFVATEFYQDWGTAAKVRHDFQIITQGHLKKAGLIGSMALMLPPGESDDYLRIYADRVPIGEWGGDIAQRVGHPHAYLYRGHIFEHMRWGYLNWLPAILISHAAMERVGPFRAEFRNGADFHFLAMLARDFRANMIGIPSAFKHEKSAEAASLKEEHLAGGKNSYRLATAHLQFFEELFWSVNPGDRELGMIRRFHHFDAGRAALGLGERALAIKHLHVAALPKAILWRAYVLIVFALAQPSDRLVAKTYQLVVRVSDILRRLTLKH